MSAPVVANIILGKAKVWSAPFGEAKPDETSVAYDADWGGNWDQIGYTKAPLTAVYETDEMEVEVEEELSAVDRLKIAERLRIETILAELTGTYLALAAGVASSKVTTTASGVGQVGYEELKLGGEATLEKLAWGFEAEYVDAAGASFPVRLFIHKGTAMINGPMEFSQRSGNYPGISLQVKALADGTQSAGEKLFQFQRVTAAAS